MELSRGEKQRITLARALLKDAPILIFDEATASIDRDSSRAIMHEISEQMTNRTIVMVTHDASLLELADRVICIRDGGIDFNGLPSEYLAREGLSVQPIDTQPGDQPTPHQPSLDDKSCQTEQGVDTIGHADTRSGRDGFLGAISDRPPLSTDSESESSSKADR